MPRRTPSWWPPKRRSNHPKCQNCGRPIADGERPFCVCITATPETGHEPVDSGRRDT